MMDCGAAMSGASWFVVRSLGGREKQVAEAIADELGAAVHLPLERVTRRCPRTKRPFRIEVPAFPPYLFAALEKREHWRWVAEMPLIAGLLCRPDGAPAAVPPGLVEALRERGIVDAELAEEEPPEAHSFRQFAKDMRLRVVGGLIEGAEGRYVGARPGRVILDVDSERGTVRVELSETLVTLA